MRISARLPAFETVPGWKDRRPAATVAARPFEVGNVLGGTYRLTRRLQRGGMGEVFLATHERLPMEFAVKVLNPFFFDDEAFAQFQHEASLLAQLRHPNIVQLVDFDWTDDARPYLVMEHLPGTDLGQVLSAQPLLAPEQIFGVVHQAACGLYAAHRAGIAHLDLKPSNLMLISYEGRGSLVKLIDFGVALVDSEETADGSGGTPEFMSPEQIAGRCEEIGFASDQFAVAVITYLLFTGTLPWQGAGDDLAQAIASSPPQPMPMGAEHTAVEAVLSRGLAKSPGRRHTSTLAFARALRRAMGRDGFLPDLDGYYGATDKVSPLTGATGATTAASSIVTTPQPSPRAHAARRPAASAHRRQRAGLVLLCAVMVALLGLLATPAWGHGTEAWRSLRQYASQAATACLAQGRSLLAAARGGRGP